MQKRENYFPLRVPALLSWFRPAACLDEERGFALRTEVSSARTASAILAVSIF
jgi:hypothetical protein